MKNMEMGPNYIGNIKHYFQNIKKIINDAESNNRELSSDDIHQINTDIMSLNHNLEFGKVSLGDAGISQEEYEKYVKPEVAKAA